MTSIRSFMKELFKSHNYITVVSGLPRSGTSMMMSALQKGGMVLLTDHIRLADANNPKGYFEYEPVKKLPKGETGWLRQACGKAVKIISALIEFLPDRYHYKIIFMEREMDEILASQERMLVRYGKENQANAKDEHIQKSYEEHLTKLKLWLKEKNRMQTYFISYNDILRQPLTRFKQVASFLDHRVDPNAMAKVVDANLYCERG